MSARGSCRGRVLPGGHSIYDPCPDPECHRFQRPDASHGVGARRRQLGLTQAELAARVTRLYKPDVTLTSQWVSDVERGARAVRSLHQARALAEALGCGVDDLLGGRRQ